MDELSGNQLCDERPRLHAGSDGEDTGFCQTQSKRGAPRLNCPEKKMGVKLGGAGAWRNAKGLSGEYGYGLCLHFIKSTCETHTSKATQVYIFTLFNGYFSVF